MAQVARRRLATYLRAYERIGRGFVEALPAAGSNLKRATVEDVQKCSPTIAFGHSDFGGVAKERHEHLVLHAFNVDLQAVD